MCKHTQLCLVVLLRIFYTWKDESCNMDLDVKNVRERVEIVEAERVCFSDSLEHRFRLIKFCYDVKVGRENKNVTIADEGKNG